MRRGLERILLGGQIAVLWLVGIHAAPACADWPEFELPSFDVPAFDWPTTEERASTLFQWRESSPVVAEESAITTDRPDFTEASSTVGAGVCQLETGYTFVMDRDGGTTSAEHSIPEALLRVGVLRDWLELRMAWNFSAEYLPAASTSGAEDLYVGTKLALTLQDGLFPEMSIVPQLTIPTGSRSRTADRALPGVNLLYGWDINDFLCAGGSTQFNQTIDGETGSEFTEWAQSWTFGYTLGEHVGAYTEWFAFFPDGAEAIQTEHYLNGGFTFRPTDDIQWDLRIGMGLNDAADDLFCGVGYSVRWH
ncbi:transporter [Planctomyces sp. SH-PL14]|uniref:transporter n=1 Tax=Planctomyces sp. SH-PL14 TaxID=1632864 RepID=UPI00078E1C7E|nr:transporter [Planctomyces sp. SH-PL14]AMV20193.1 hypothetical protein VT03_20015 [Planctomyces sp. SH-PL14]